MYFCYNSTGKQENLFCGEAFLSQSGESLQEQMFSNQDVWQNWMMHFN